MSKKTMLITVLAALVAALTPLAAQHVRLGVAGGVELWNRPTYDDVREAFDDEAEVAPGLYWEVIHGNFGWGMTGLVKFNRLDPAIPGGEYDWYFDWIASWDLRYHFLPRFLLDPFVELGLGSAGRGHVGAEDNPMGMSIFSQIGGGLALNLRGVHLGTRVVYRLMNDPIPATTFEVYPLKGFHVDVFAGLSL